MNEAELTKLARSLMDQHGLTDWTFKHDNARRRLGGCISKLKTITISRHHAAQHTDEQVRDTILHEIAHALTSDCTSHGEEWKEVCRRIGAIPKRRAEYRIEGPWKVSCPECRKIWDLYRRERRYCIHHPDLPLQWVNTETGETWDGTVRPKQPKYRILYVCSRCGNRWDLNPNKYSYVCPCRFRNKEWVRTKVELRYE